MLAPVTSRAASSLRVWHVLGEVLTPQVRKWTVPALRAWLLLFTSAFSRTGRDETLGWSQLLPREQIDVVPMAGITLHLIRAPQVDAVVARVLATVGWSFEELRTGRAPTAASGAPYSRRRSLGRNTSIQVTPRWCAPGPRAALWPYPLALRERDRVRVWGETRLIPGTQGGPRVGERVRIPSLPPAPKGRGASFRPDVTSHSQTLESIEALPVPSNRLNP